MASRVLPCKGLLGCSAGMLQSYQKNNSPALTGGGVLYTGNTDNLLGHFQTNVIVHNMVGTVITFIGGKHNTVIANV